MSWDNKQGPWGKEQRPPEIDELLEKVQEKVSNLFGGKRFASIGLLAIVVVLLWLATGIYQVNQDQVGVVQRFGKYSRTVGPGLQWKLPSGLEKATKVATQRIYQEEFGLRTLRAGVRTEYAPESQYERESLMLTGDLNCVLVPWVVRYRIGDPYKFLFRIRNVRETLRSLSEATMRTVVGDRSYGKGSVQGIFPLASSRAGLRLTTAKFYSPNGRPISRQGVQPHLAVQRVAKPATDGAQPPAAPPADSALESAVQVARQQIARR